MLVAYKIWSLKRALKCIALLLVLALLWQLMHYHGTSTGAASDPMEVAVQAAPAAVVPETNVRSFKTGKIVSQTSTIAANKLTQSVPSSTSTVKPILASSGGATSTTRLKLLPTLPAVRQRAIDRAKNVAAFAIFATQQERNIMLSLLSKFDRVMKHFNVTYIIYGGTLLGSHRHHGIIPWDDDIDLLVNKSSRSRIPGMLKHLEPDLTLYTAGGHDKVSHTLSQHTSQYLWRWPYLDVSYFLENHTHIWDHTDTYNHWFVYPKLITLPTHPRPLDGLWLPSPRDTLAFLQVTYGRTGTCLTSSYSHMIEDGMPGFRRPCVLLKDKVTFVHRRPCNATYAGSAAANATCVHESLQLKGRVLQTLTVAEPRFAINNAYSLKLESGFTQPPDYPYMSDIDL